MHTMKELLNPMPKGQPISLDDFDDEDFQIPLPVYVIKEKISQPEVGIRDPKKRVRQLDKDPQIAKVARSTLDIEPVPHFIVRDAEGAKVRNFNEVYQYAMSLFKNGKYIDYLFKIHSLTDWGIDDAYRYLSVEINFCKGYAYFSERGHSNPFSDKYFRFTTEGNCLNYKDYFYRAQAYLFLSKESYALANLDQAERLIGPLREITVLRTLIKNREHPSSPILV